MKLRILEYLVELAEFCGAAVSAKLTCDCGNRFFKFYHTGRQTRGILAPYIVKKNRQLRLQAKCTCCERVIEVYNSSIDGSKAKACEQSNEFEPFIIPKRSKDSFEVVVKYNYLPKNLKKNGEYSNLFEECFVYILDNSEEINALIEE